MKKHQNSKQGGFAIIGVIAAYLVFVSATLFVIFFMNQRREAARNLEATRVHLRHRAYGLEDVNGGIESYEVTNKPQGDFRFLDVITDHPDDRVRGVRVLKDTPMDSFSSSACSDEPQLDWESELWQRKSCRRAYKQHTKIYYRFFGYDRDRN